MIYSQRVSINIYLSKSLGEIRATMITLSHPYQSPSEYSNDGKRGTLRKIGSGENLCLDSNHIITIIYLLPSLS